MTIRHLIVFICVCDEITMTRAAQKLHMTQPSVSQAMQELESHYGVQLFERLGRKLFLTAAGQKLLTYARPLVNLHAQTEEDMRQFGSIYRVRLGASVTIGECVLVELLRQLKLQYPQNQIFSAIHNTAVLENMLLTDDLDLALVEGEVHSEYLTVRPFMKDELIFIASPTHPLCRKKSLYPSDLEDATYFVREEGSGTRNLFERIMRGANIKFRIVGTYNNAETIKKAVSAGLGISVISKLAVQGELADGRLCRLAVNSLAFERAFSIIHHKNKYLSKELQQIISFCARLSSSV